MIRTIVHRLPSSWISYCGQLQFKLPWLRAPIARIAQRLVSKEGVIQRGIGRGLRFDATGGYPGYLLGTSELDEQALLERLLTPGATFFDIGANIGFYSTLAARLVGDEGRVFAFEPFPESAEACRKNARLNGFKHVIVIEGAVGAASGTAWLAAGESSAVHRINEVADGIEVSVYAIDTWRVENDITAPSVVMIDVEGAEIEVLKGMMQTIREKRPIIMIEVHWLGSVFPDFVEEQLIPLGYRCTTYNGAPLPQGSPRFHALLIAGQGSTTPLSRGA